MKIFNGSHSKAFAWALLVCGTAISIITKDVTAFVVAVPIAGGLIANKTYQARKDNELE